MRGVIAGFFGADGQGEAGGAGDGVCGIIRGGGFGHEEAAIFELVNRVGAGDSSGRAAFDVAEVGGDAVGVARDGADVDSELDDSTGARIDSDGQAI